MALKKTRLPTKEELDRMWAFAVCQSESFNNSRSPHNIRLNLASECIWRRFQIANTNEAKIIKPSEYFLTEMAPNIHLAPLDNFQKVTLYLALNIPVETSFLAELEKIGYVVLNERGCLKSFSSEPTEETKDTIIKRPRNNFTAEEDEAMWNYLYMNMDDSETGEILKQNRYYTSPKFWSLFVRDGGSERSSKTIASRFSILIKRLSETHFDTMTKARFYFALDIPVDRKFLEELKKVANVEIDDRQCLSWFGELREQNEDVNEILTAKASPLIIVDESTPVQNSDNNYDDPDDHVPFKTLIEIERISQMKRKMYDRDMKTWKFVMDHMADKETGELLKREEVDWRQLFVSNYEDDLRDGRAAFEHFSTNLLPYLYFSKEFDLKTKTELLYVLTYPLNYCFYIKLLEVAEVELDDCGCISAYSWKNHGFQDESISDQTEDDCYECVKEDEKNSESRKRENAIGESTADDPEKKCRRLEE